MLTNQYKTTVHLETDIDLRPFQDDCDFALIASIMQRCLHADRVLRLPTEDVISHTYARLRNFNRYRDVRIAIQAGKPVGYVRLNWELAPGGEISLQHQSFTLPQQRHAGVSETLLNYAEGRLTPLAKQECTTGRAYLMSGAYESEVEKWGLLERSGYRIETTYHDMAYDLKQVDIVPASLSNFEVRPAAPEDMQALWILLQETNGQWAGHHPEGLNVWRQHSLIQPTLWRALYHGDDLIGCSLCHINHEENRVLGKRRAYVDKVAISLEWHTPSLVAVILENTLAGLAEQGIRRAYFRVKRDDNLCGRRFLKGLGFQTVKRFSLYQKSLN